MSGKVWFTSDTHFQDFWGMHFFNRPFSRVTELNTTLIGNWNNVVAPNDDVYHLGDFGTGSIKGLKVIFQKLHGSKYLIRGNNDPKGIEQFPWVAVYDKTSLELKDVELVLSHKPIPLKKLKGKSENVWNIHGHLHGFGWNRINKPRIDLSSDCWNFTPVSSDELYSIMKGEKVISRQKVSHGVSSGRVTMGSSEEERNRSTWIGSALRSMSDMGHRALKCWRKIT